jgi:hypothetical protein
LSLLGLLSPKFALFGLASAVAACPLLKDERTYLGSGPRFETHFGHGVR